MVHSPAQDGTTYWSARDLAPLMGYTNWRNMSASVDRAQAAARNSGLTCLFDTNIKKGTGGRSAEDYHLDRMAAYLVAAENTGMTCHFAVSRKMVNRPQGGGMEQTDYHLDRMAAYLVAAENTGVTCHFLRSQKTLVNGGPSVHGLPPGPHGRLPGRPPRLAVPVVRVVLPDHHAWTAAHGRYPPRRARHPLHP